MAAILFIGIILPGLLLDMIGAPEKRPSVRHHMMGGSRNDYWPFGLWHRRKDEQEQESQGQAHAQKKA